MKIIKTPWKNELLDLVAKSKKSIKISSPFVKENICNEILDVKRKETSLDLITSFKLMNIYSGSLDLSGLESILKNKGVVKNFSQLHAKIYIFDDEKVIITSGNLTNGGLLNNYEYGVFSNDLSIVNEVVADFHTISNNENTGIIKRSDINIVREIISKLPKSETLRFPTLELESPEQKNDIIEIPNSTITSSLGGWKLDVFTLVSKIPESYFTLDNLKTYESFLKDKYPDNNTVMNSLRRTLQELRDLGLIEFLGNGNYKKLWI